MSAAVMRPTAKLRFVERRVPLHPFYKTVDADGRMCQAVQVYNVLQQWWESVPIGTINLGFGGEIPMSEVTGEWRDVQVETEGESK